MILLAAAFTLELLVIFSCLTQGFVKGNSHRLDFYTGDETVRRNGQERAELKTSMTFDLDYSSDVLLSTNARVLKVRRNRPKSSRKTRDIKGKAVGCPCPGSAPSKDYYPYDYDQFRREYFDLNWDRRNDSRMEPGKPKRNLAYHCRPDEWLDGVGMIALYCTLRRGFEMGFTKPVFTRLISLARFWLIVYLVAGGSLWIICGWCCCCLKCKTFKPEEIRQEVRNYIQDNPPGVLRHKSRGEKITYTPTREEMNAYNELEIKAYAYV